MSGKDADESCGDKRGILWGPRLDGEVTRSRTSGLVIWLTRCTHRKPICRYLTADLSFQVGYDRQFVSDAAYGLSAGIKCPEFRVMFRAGNSALCFPASLHNFRPRPSPRSFYTRRLDRSREPPPSPFFDLRPRLSATRHLM